MPDKSQYPYYCAKEPIETLQHKKGIESDLHPQSDDISAMVVDIPRNTVKLEKQAI